MLGGRCSVLVPVASVILVGAFAGSREPLAAIVGSLTVFGVVIGFARPLQGLGVAAFLSIFAPFLVVPQRLGIQPPVVDLVVVVAFLGIVSRFNRYEYRSLPHWLIAVVVLAAGLPILASMAAYSGRPEWQTWQTAAKLSFYTATPLIVAMLSPSARSVRSCVTLVACATTLQAGLAIVLFWMGGTGIAVLASLGAVGYPALDVARFLPDQVTARATGLMVDPNVLGVSLAAGLPFLLYHFRARRSLAVLSLVGTVLVVVALGLTISRSSWIASAVGMLVWIAIGRPRLAILAAVLLAGCVAVLPFEVFVRIRDGLTATDRSAALRVDEIQEAFRVITRFPWLGVGYGTSPHPDIFVGVSNAWLWLAERAGLGAATIHLGLTGLVVRLALGRVRQEPLLGPLLASLTTFSVAGLFDHHIVSFPTLVFLFGCLIGLIVVTARSSLADAQ
jgi:O-antigen ligase